MPPTSYAKSTLSASVGTEHFVSNPNVPGTFTFHVNTMNMTLGDAVEIRAYQMMLTGQTSYVAYYRMYDGTQPVDDRLKITLPIANELTDNGALRFSIEQTAGVSKSFDYKVMGYDLG